MGFFDLKAICSVCNSETGLNRFQIADKKWVCKECFKKAGFTLQTPIKKMDVKDIFNAIEQRKLEIEEFNQFCTTKKIGTFIEFDDNNRKWLIPDGILGGKKNPKIYDYSDIIGFELLEDGESITTGGFGKAVAGGILLGGVGAVVGGVTGKKKNKAICNSLRIKLTIKNKENPMVLINFIKTEVKKSSFTYKSLYDMSQECLSYLENIIDSNEPEIINTQLSVADEILKFKALMDEGIITEEEFNNKKKQLLESN